MELTYDSVYVTELSGVSDSSVPTVVDIAIKDGEFLNFRTNWNIIGDKGRFILVNIISDWYG